MAAGTLYTYPENFRANKALVAAQISGTEVKVAPSFKFGETNKSSDFLKKFPTGKVPCFEAKDGFCLSESNAIAYYVANSQLRGTDEKQQALVQQWINFSDNEIVPASCNWTFPCLGITQFNKQETEKAKQQIQKSLQILNDCLLTNTYIVGERITLADISLVCNLQSLFELVLDPAFRKPYGNVMRWFTTLINNPHFKSVLGTVKLAESMATFDAKKYQELHGGAGDKKKENKVQDKPKPQPKVTEESAPTSTEKVDPFKDLPTGKFVLDVFKKTYRNEETETVAIPHFWENFDWDCYSVWIGDYQYPEDLKMEFMACNLVSGMFQRLEKLRKTCLGIGIIGGKGNKFFISQLWICQGQKPFFELNDDWNIDAPSFKWTKMEKNGPDAKRLIDLHLMTEGEFEHGTATQCKLLV